MNKKISQTPSKQEQEHVNYLIQAGQKERQNVKTYLLQWKEKYGQNFCLENYKVQNNIKIPAAVYILRYWPEDLVQFCFDEIFDINQCENLFYEITKTDSGIGSWDEMRATTIRQPLIFSVLNYQKVNWSLKDLLPLHWSKNKSSLNTLINQKSLNHLKRFIPLSEPSLLQTFDFTGNGLVHHVAKLSKENLFPDTELVEIVNLLHSKGVDVLAPNDENQTALDLVDPSSDLAYRLNGIQTQRSLETRLPKTQLKPIEQTKLRL